MCPSSMILYKQRVNRSTYNIKMLLKLTTIYIIIESAYILIERVKIIYLMKISLIFIYIKNLVKVSKVSIVE